MTRDVIIITLVAIGVVFGVALFVRWLPLSSADGQLKRRRREIERQVAERRLGHEIESPAQPRLTFGCLMKWLAALGLASWTAGLAAWAVYVIVILGVVLAILLLALAVVGIWACFAASFVASMHL